MKITKQPNYFVYELNQGDTLYCSVFNSGKEVEGSECVLEVGEEVSVMCYVKRKPAMVSYKATEIK